MLYMKIYSIAERSFLDSFAFLISKVMTSEGFFRLQEVECAFGDTDTPMSHSSQSKENKRHLENVEYL